MNTTWKDFIRKHFNLIVLYNIIILYNILVHFQSKNVNLNNSCA